MDLFHKIIQLAELWFRKNVFIQPQPFHSIHLLIAIPHQWTISNCFFITKITDISSIHPSLFTNNELGFMNERTCRMPFQKLLCYETFCQLYLCRTSFTFFVIWTYAIVNETVLKFPRSCTQDQRKSTQISSFNQIGWWIDLSVHTFTTTNFHPNELW
jgi:hypothetical protein